MSVGFQTFRFSSDASALEDSFLTAIEKSSRENLEPIHILIPNYYVASHLRHLLAQRKPVLNLRFLTLEDLARLAVQHDPAFLSKIQMTTEMELFHIRDIAKSVLRGSKLEIISDKRGVHQNLRKLFHHFISHGSKKIPHINEKTTGFDRMFQMYSAIKKKYYNDLWLIESAIAATKKEASHLYIFGFAQFSPLQMRFLQTWEEHAEIHLWMERPFFEDLQEAIFTWAGESFEDSQEIPGVSPQNLQIESCSHLQDEAEWISQKIVEYQRSNPSPFHTFGVFLNDFHKQKSYIEQAFKKYRIPHVVQGGQPLSSTSLGQGLHVLAELLFQNWKRDEWIRFLQSFPFPPSVYETCGNPNEWNQWTIDAQITDKNTFFIQRLEHLDHNQKHPKLKAFIEWQKNLISALDQVEQKFSRSIQGFFQKCFEWIQANADPEKIQDEHAIFFDDLIYMSRSFGASATWMDLKPIFIEKLRAPSVRDHVFESDGVFVAPLSALPGLTFKSIFLPFLNEGSFPKTTSQPFDLTSQEMFRITQSSGIPFPSAEHEFGMQKAFFDTASSRCDQIHISYSQFALPNQEELRPSVFLQGLPRGKLFTNDWQPALINASNPSFTQHIQKYHEHLQSPAWSTYNASVSNPPSKQVYSARDITTYLTCPRQYYLSQVLRISVDEFPENRFQAAPKDKGNLIHKILFELFTRLKSENLFPLQIKNENKIIDIAKTAANETLDRFVVSHAYGSEEMWRIDREELLNDVIHYIKHEIQENSYWIPMALEYRFGMISRGLEEDPLSTEKSVNLPVLDNNMAFRGKIDRIDVSSDRKAMRIVDYKTGAFKHVNWNYEKGGNLQVPLYMLLAKYFFQDVQPERVEGALVHIKTFSKFDKRILPHESLSNVEEKVLELLDIANTGIQKGKFYPNPGSGRSNCRFCDFQTFCGENIDRDIEPIPTDAFMEDYYARKDALK